MPFRLYRDVPLAAAAGNCHLLCFPQDQTTFPVGNPSDLGQEDSGVILIYLETLRVTETVVFSALLEFRQVGSSLKEVFVSPVLIFQLLLKYL